MASHTVPMQTTSTPIQPIEAEIFDDVRDGFVEAPECRNRSGRGALTGVLLGAGLWAAILTATGVIKL